MEVDIGRATGPVSIWNAISSRCTVFALLVSCTVIVASLLSLLDTCRPYLVLRPAQFLPSYFWTVFSTSFVESSFFGLLFSVSFVFLTVPILQRSTSEIQLSQLIAVATAASGLSSVATAYFLFYVFSRTQVLFQDVNGFHGLAGALVAALQQKLQGQEFMYWGWPLSADILPVAYLGLAFATFVLRGWLIDLAGAIAGTVAGWWFLNKAQPGTDINSSAPVDFFPSKAVACLQSAWAFLAAHIAAQMPGISGSNPPAKATQKHDHSAGDVEVERSRASMRRMALGAQALSSRMAEAASAGNSEALTSESTAHTRSKADQSSPAVLPVSEDAVINVQP